MGDTPDEEIQAAEKRALVAALACLDKPPQDGICCGRISLSLMNLTPKADGAEKP